MVRMDGAAAAMAETEPGSGNRRRPMLASVTAAVVILAAIVGTAGPRMLDSFVPEPTATVLASPEPSAAGTPAALPTPSPTPFERTGILPDELIGRGFVIGDDQTQEIWVAGALGGPTLRLPGGEKGLDADGTRILSVSGEVGSQELIVRSYPSGEEEVRFPVTEPVDYGVLRGDLVYWSGSEFEFDAASEVVGRDGGVWRMVLPDGVPEALITPGPLEDGFTGRGWPVLSPSGRTMGALLCKLQSYEGGPCIAQILDLETGQLRTLLEDSGLAVLTDEIAVQTGFGKSLKTHTFNKTLL